MARQVYDHLCERDKQLALAGRPHEIQFKPYIIRSNATQSPLALAWMKVQELHLEFQGRKYGSIRGALRLWFIRHYTHGETVLCHNKHRSKAEVSEALLAPFRDVLTRKTWTDNCQRERRYLSLGQYHAALTSAPKCAKKLQKFTEDWNATGVRSLVTLQGMVVDRFDLRKRYEKFKRPRRKDLARVCAEVWLGREPVREHFTHYKKTSSKKIVTVKLHTDEYTEYLESVAPPAAAAAASTSAATRQQHLGRTAAFLGTQYKYEKLFLGPREDRDDPEDMGVWNMICHIDGFTVELRREAGSLRNQVFIEPTELLPILEDDMLDPNVSALEKIYYFVIMVPGYGIRAAVAMRSGTRLRVDKSCDSVDTMPFWYDQLSDFELPQARQRQSMLREKAPHYKVRPCCLSVARMLSRVQSPGRILTRGIPIRASAAVF
jgi:hypothetical protein